MTAKDFNSALKIIGLDYSGAIPKREIFSLAKEFQNLPLTEVVKLLKHNYNDHRLGAVSILDWKARNNKISEEEKKDIFCAYIDNHKWIDNWGLVDRAAPHVVGGYLFDKDRTVLYDLAKSNYPMQRRTAIVSTYYFLRKNDIEDTFKIAEILVYDDNESVQKAVGSWIREAGKRNEEKLKNFLNKYAKKMPRITLRYAIEKFDKPTRTYYLNLKNEDCK